MITAPISFREADRLIASREPTPTARTHRQIVASWSDGMRARAFFAARCTNAAILAQLKTLTEKIVAGRMTQGQAVRLVREMFAQDADALAAMGFAPKEDAHGVAELASVARLNLIFYTQTRMAQEKGHYEQWQRIRDKFPYAVWHCGYAHEHRAEHLARDGRVYAFDHPVWTQSPPGGEFNCHCWREVITERQLRERGLVPEPLDSAFRPSSLGFDPSMPLDAHNGISPGSGIPPELRPVPPPAAPDSAPAPAPPAAPVPVPEETPEQRRERRRTQWQEAYRKRLEKYRAANSGAVESALRKLPEDERGKFRPVLQGVADSCTACYTADAARLGKPPRLEFFKNEITVNGEKLECSAFVPDSGDILINYADEWQCHRNTVRHEFEHWAHWSYYRRLDRKRQTRFVRDVRKAGQLDLAQIENDYRRGNREHLLHEWGAFAKYNAKKLYGKAYSSLDTGQRIVVTSIADIVGDLSRGNYICMKVRTDKGIEYIGPHERSYYKMTFRAGADSVHCETIAQLPGLVAAFGADWVKRHFPNMYGIYGRIGY